MIQDPRGFLSPPPPGGGGGVVSWGRGVPSGTQPPTVSCAPYPAHHPRRQAMGLPYQRPDCLALAGPAAFNEDLQWTGLLPVRRLREYDHHLCHAAQAYYESPFARALVVVADGGGNTTRSSFAHCAAVTAWRHSATASPPPYAASLFISSGAPSLLQARGTGSWQHTHQPTPTYTARHNLHN